MLRGLFQAANTFKSFQLVFDWFTEHLKIMEKCLAIYSDKSNCDDEVVLLIMKFMLELADNSSNRLRFDTWSINGLIVFKEVSAQLINILIKFDCFTPQGKAVRHDRYQEIFKYVKRSICILERFVLGNYINFAMCEYY